MGSAAIAPSPPGEIDGGQRLPGGILSQPLAIYLILGSFFCVTVPLSAAVLRDESFFAENRWLFFAYVWLLGSTHFVLTLSIYLQSSNLRYFNRSWKNRTLYFVVPVLILVLFDLFKNFQAALAWPIVGVMVLSGIRLLDFHHFGRQSYGVLQLLKGRSKHPFPGWLRRAENLFFLGITALIWSTFLLGGRFRFQGLPVAAQLLTGVLLAFVGSTLALVLYGFLRTWRQTENRRALLVPLSYFVMQTACAALAFSYTGLYLFALATHYVEYHVLMFPRCFHVPLHLEARVDRLFHRLRSRKALFYGVLLVLAGFFTWRLVGGMADVLTAAEETGTSPLLLLIALFDGLFILHYFVESLIWKFGDPYYRQSLAGLYLPRP